MGYPLSRFLGRYIGFMALASLTSGACLSSALAEEQRALANEPTSSSRTLGESLTEFETLELHYRRYTAAANTMAQLFKQLNQKIQEVSLAAKTADAKNNSHNRRMLEDKLRQLENTRTSTSHQYAQLQSQLQNEYRSYTAISNELKAKYGTPRDSKNGRQEVIKEPNSESHQIKEPESWGAKTR